MKITVVGAGAVGPGHLVALIEHGVGADEIHAQVEHLLQRLGDRELAN